MAQICPACGFENQDDAGWCAQCRAALSSAVLDEPAFFPPTEAMSDSIFCPLCIDLRSGRMTHIGQVRKVNQDSLLVLEMNRISNSVSLPLGIYAVADGVGGRSSGEIASKQVIDVIVQKSSCDVISPYLSQGSFPLTDPTSWMIETTRAANQSLYQLCQDMHTSMSTTLVWAMVVDDTAYIANVGDSRAYLCASDGYRQITRDHSLVGQLVAGGQLTPEQARLHPHRNVIYRTLGETLDLDVDVFVEPLYPGRVLLLCSDGLSTMLTDEALWQGAMSDQDLAQACACLVRQANEAGGHDNISVILVELAPM